MTTIESGVSNKRSSRSVTDFTLAERSLSSSQVALVIIGTLVGGASTIGTVQMAVGHGLAAWYFTLGAGLACLGLALFFARPLREAEVTTVAEFLGRSLGPRFQTYVSIITSLGMFVHVVAQYVAMIAILQAVAQLSPRSALAMTTLLHGILVAGGGMHGAATMGRFKFFFLSALMLYSAGMAVYLSGGFEGIRYAFRAAGGLRSAFSYGVVPGLFDLGAVIMGVMSTQIYLQALFAARDVRAAQRGALLAAALVPLIGLLAIVVGLYMRLADPGVKVVSAQALPGFLVVALPPWMGLPAAAILCLVVLGTGAGLALGVTTNVHTDILAWTSEPGSRGQVGTIRRIAIIVCTVAGLVVFIGQEAAILEWSYLSMGLRGTAVFAGLTIAVFAPRLTSRASIRILLYALPIAYVVLKLIVR